MLLHYDGVIKISLQLQEYGSINYIYTTAKI